MKYFLVVLSIVITLLSFSSCSELNQKSDISLEDQSSFVGGFELVGSSRGNQDSIFSNSDYFYYYRDIITDVMYVCFEEYGQGGMTEMHDPVTGLPLTYTRYLELIDDKIG